MSKEQRRAADCHRLPSVPGFEVAVAGALRSHRAQVWSVKMSMRSAPTLQRLAMHSLLSNPSLAISALEDVPVLLFPSLFLEAYAQGLTEVLKAMVQAWPFPCLPLGDLTESPELETLKAALDGLDLLVAKKDRPSRWKLHVLDLRSAYPNIWKRGYPHMMRVSCPDILPEEPTARPGSEKPEEQQPLMIVADLTIKDGPQDAFQAYLLGWARKRKARVQLCCRQLQILSPSTHQIQKALRAVRPDSIRELVVNSFWHRETMKRFAPSLSRMKNLELLDFSKMSAHVYTSRSRNFWYSRKYAAHLGQLQRLQELRLHDVFFLRGQLPAILRSQSPLKTLSLTACPLKEADLRFLSQCPCTRRLKHLRLRSVLMADFSPEPLRALLEHVAGTLETLALEDCAITDGQLSAILPALGRCSQLRFLSFYGNRISMATLHSLLSHTASLGRLSQGLYPAPLESFLPPDWCLGHIHPEAFAQVRARLAQAWRDSGTTQKLQICTDFCHRRHKGQFYSLGSDGYWVVTHEALPALSALPV